MLFSSLTLFAASTSSALAAAIPNLSPRGDAQPLGLKLEGTNLCLDNKDWVDAEGQGVQLWECHGGANQLWSAQRTRDAKAHGTDMPLNYFRLQRSEIDKCLHFDYASPSGEGSATAGGSATRAVDLVIKSCASATEWFWYDFSLCARAATDNFKNGYCLKVDGDEPHDGSKLIVVNAAEIKSKFFNHNFSQ